MCLFRGSCQPEFSDPASSSDILRTEGPHLCFLRAPLAVTRSKAGQLACGRSLQPASYALSDVSIISSKAIYLFTRHPRLILSACVVPLHPFDAHYRNGGGKKAATPPASLSLKNV